MRVSWAARSQKYTEAGSEATAACFGIKVSAPSSLNPRPSLSTLKPKKQRPQAEGCRRDLVRRPAKAPETAAAGGLSEDGAAFAGPETDSIEASMMANLTPSENP